MDQSLWKTVFAKSTNGENRHLYGPVILDKV